MTVPLDENGVPAQTVDQTWLWIEYGGELLDADMNGVDEAGAGRRRRTAVNICLEFEDMTKPSAICRGLRRWCSGQSPGTGQRNRRDVWLTRKVRWKVTARAGDSETGRVLR
ncbi:hypothetical protein ACLQ28_31505 [Micromonospora sp. DT201]|uniref:hypothetical protein n=1 Tax=Micromonospora sp. DT201 TaxID=3393442 RepID=UPI003CE91EE4